MTDENKNLQMCQDGKVCAPVIELSIYLKTMKKNMADHTEDSKKFWEETQKKVDSVVEGMQKGALMFNDGGHKMEKLETDINGVGEKLHLHEKGEYGAHSTVKTQFTWHRWGIIAIFFVVGAIGTFILIKHPESINTVGKFFKVVP